MSGGNLTVELQKVFEEYSEEVKRATNNAAEKVAKESLSKLKNTSPRKTGSYARGWAIKRERGVSGINTVTIHNKTDYQLTHLLENGHVIRNKKGTYGRAPGHKHIQPVEEWANNELPLEIERELQ